MEREMGVETPRQGRQVSDAHLGQTRWWCNSAALVGPLPQGTPERADIMSHTKGGKIPNYQKLCPLAADMQN